MHDEHTPKQMICSKCGSTGVTRDAWAVWEVTTQNWSLGAVFDAAYCDICSGETHIKEVEYDEEVEAEGDHYVITG